MAGRFPTDRDQMATCGAAHKQVLCACAIVLGVVGPAPHEAKNVSKCGWEFAVVVVIVAMSLTYIKEFYACVTQCPGITLCPSARNEEDTGHAHVDMGHNASVAAGLQSHRPSVSLYTKIAERTEK